MRKMACVKRIEALDPIEGADAIEVATIGGWSVVVQKGLHKVNDLVVYCEVDSWIPADVAPFLLKDRIVPREYRGVPGEKLRTIRLRGQISQGLILPISVLEDQDVSDALNIRKWEPADDFKNGETKSTFPSFIPKTDAERVENSKGNIKRWQERDHPSDVWEITEKLEGSSFTAYLHEGNFGVCSRNQELKLESENSWVRLARKLDLEVKMREVFGEDGSYAIQGEMVGSGIQGNIYKLDEHRLYVFNIYDIKAGKYVTVSEKNELVEKLGLTSAPLISYVGTDELDVKAIIEFAEGKSLLNPNHEREGVVYKNENNPQHTFKAISRKYSLKKDKE